MDKFEKEEEKRKKEQKIENIKKQFQQQINDYQIEFDYHVKK